MWERRTTAAMNSHCSLPTVPISHRLQVLESVNFNLLSLSRFVRVHFMRAAGHAPVT